MFGKVLFSAVIAGSIASTGCASSAKPTGTAANETVHVQSTAIAQLDESIAGETVHETAEIEESPASVTQPSKKKDAKSKKKRKKGGRKKSNT